HKQVSNLEAQPAKKSKPKKKKTDPKTEPEPIKRNIGLDATIITDTKNNKMDLFSSVSKSLREWYKEVTKPRKKKTPKYTVPEASRRKGVIQKATTKTGSIFTADSETLKAQIRHRQQQAALAQKEDEAETLWSPYTDPGYNLLEAPDETPPAAVQNVKFEYKKRPAAPLAPPTPTLPLKQNIVRPRPSIPPPPSEDDHRWDAPAPWVQPEPVKVPEAPVVEPIPEIHETKIPEVETSVVVPEVEDVIPPIEPEQPENEVYVPTPTVEPEPELEPIQSYTKVRERTNQLSFIERVDTNTLTVITLLTIIGIVIIIVISRLFILYMSNGLDSSTPTVAPVKVLLQDSNLTTIALSAENINSLPQQVNSETRPSDVSITEIAFVSPAGEEVGPSYVFELLEFQAAPTLKQSLTNARFLISSNSEEVLLLKFIDDITVRGGFLSWETTMGTDFASFYGYEPSSNASFVDGDVQGLDVRALIQNGETVLVYCIIDDNTALVAASKGDLEKMIVSKFSK
ncbi:hypothetical protein KC730_02540, partial [Candidatus Kaiserbacteria bacterium]|nr:hypothetical protein [Candidatus Kaiserbacteria bacterium]